MQIDESIAQLGVKLDGWLDRSLPVFSSDNRAVRGKAIRRGIAIIKEFDRLKAEGIAAITALLNRHVAPADSDNRNASLIRAFEFGAKLADALHDEFLDTDGERMVWRLLDRIVLALDKVGPSRAAMNVLFDNPDPGVRASAGTYLIDLMPERVVPMLRDIDEAGGGRSADFRAHWTLLAWEREGKSRFNYLSKTT
jgi:hypothetical protein